MRQSEFKKNYDPEMDRYVKKHIYGEGISDVFRSIGTNLANTLATKPEISKIMEAVVLEKTID